MEDGAYATLVAAGIAAIVAAALFILGEFIKMANGRETLRREAIGQVLDALADVPREARRPRFLLRWSKTPIELSIAATRLFPVLGKRDRVLVDWLGYIAVQIAEHKTIDEKVRTAAVATGLVSAWSMRPRKVRRKLRADVERWDLEMEADYSADGRGPL